MPVLLPSAHSHLPTSWYPVAAMHASTFKAWAEAQQRLMNTSALMHARGYKDHPSSLADAPKRWHCVGLAQGAALDSLGALRSTLKKVCADGAKLALCRCPGGQRADAALAL